MIQYMSKYVPGIFSGTSLTGLGVLLGAGIMAVFVLVNWFGIQLFARVNGALTVAKFVVPTITVVALFASGFHGGNFSSHGGFAPYGWAPGLSAIATAGIIYACTLLAPLASGTLKPGVSPPRSPVARTSPLIATRRYVGARLWLAGVRSFLAPCGGSRGFCPAVQTPAS